MARESRLYAKLTLDFADSPKIAPLSDRAFREYVEALLWSRRLLTDGFIPAAMAPRLFTDAALAELTTNDPHNPSILPIDGGYQIHDFGEHQSTREDIEKKREAGSKGGKAKAAAGDPSSKPVALVSEVLKQNGSKPLAKTETETTTSNEVVNNSFDDFWSVWPRKDAKAAARKAWAKAIRTESAAEIIAAAEAYAASPYRDRGKFVPYGASWLRGERWHDPPPEPTEHSRAPPRMTAAQKNLFTVAHFARLEATDGQSRTLETVDNCFSD